MRRTFSLFSLLSMFALLAMALPYRPAVAANNPPVTGAAFTTVNEDEDGTGHCKNGNPNNNCNIYDGKEYVWLNGGPAVAYVGDGEYFFAVLSPGGQPAPNDGGTNQANGELANLSDNYDAYTNRIFTVTNGVVSYSGTHDFANNKIRLMPYEDTPNNGGVYILAICSLDKGYPVTPARCKYDAFKIREGEVTTPEDLLVTKSAFPSFTRSYEWTIDKEVDKTSVTLEGSGSAVFNYTVEVRHDGGTDGNWKVVGVITVVNPNDDDVTGVDVTDAVDNGGDCTVTDGTNATIPANGSADFDYVCTYASAPNPLAGTNTATAKWPEQSLAGYSEPLAEGSASFDAPFTFDGLAPDEIDECIDVDDSYAGFLGTVCVGDANPTTFEYSRTIAFDRSLVPGCFEYDNTATFTTNDTGTTGSDSVTVEVCFYNAALTPGYWKNHLAPLGTNLPGISASCKSKDGCSPNGPWTIQYLPQSLGTYNVDSAKKALDVFNGMNCGSSKDQDAIGCLAGHLLATKLNVANGSNPCIQSTIDAADAFLTSISYNGPGGKYTLTASQRATAISLKNALDKYNNGGGCS